MIASWRLASPLASLCQPPSVTARRRVTAPPPRPKRTGVNIGGCMAAQAKPRPTPRETGRHEDGTCPRASILRCGAFPVNPAARSHRSPDASPRPLHLAKLRQRRRLARSPTASRRMHLHLRRSRAPHTTECPNHYCSALNTGPILVGLGVQRHADEGGGRSSRTVTVRWRGVWCTLWPPLLAPLLLARWKKK